jgi:hypothetical protein
MQLAHTALVLLLLLLVVVEAAAWDFNFIGSKAVQHKGGSSSSKYRSFA